MRHPRRLVVVVVIVLLVVLIGPFLIPIPPLEGTVPPDQLADPDSRFIDIDGLQVHYKTFGEGEPTFVLLHGFAASVFSWREVTGPLAAMGRVVAFDRPAFGLTQRPLPGEWTGDSPYSPEAQVEQTVRLMDELSIDQAILVGNSAGGSISMLTALTHPDRVRALVLVDAAVYRGTAAPDWLRPLLFTPQLRRIGPLLVRSVKDWGIEFARSAWHDPSKITPEIWDGYLKPLKANDWDRGLWEFTLAGHSLGLPARLDEIQMPALVITGDDDRIVPTEESVRLVSELPDAELVVIPNCGHAPQEECPAEFLRAVEDFLGKLPITNYQ